MYLTAKETRELLRLTAMQLKRERYGGRLPYIRLGKSVLYPEAAVLAAMRSRGLKDVRRGGRPAKKITATPSWADRKEISRLYREMRARNKSGQRWHVDHIVPLQSGVVCGLHAHTNLRLLPARDNLAKGNRVWPDMP